MGSARLSRGGGWKRSRREQGFNLTELVLALVILGLLAGVSAPRFFERRTFDERLAKDEMAAALRFGQKLALVTTCEIRVQVTASTWTLDHRANCNSGAFGQAVFHPGTGKPGYAGSMPTGIALAGTVNPLHFDSQGRATDAGGVVSDATFTIGARSIDVVGATGLVRSP
ncbi:MAG: prepilin-type N-terminal cleavage/methylation domain-containing protein [bacterium]|nr:prepilin-type N-terminal cleavage/methylation domain-containing protein [bacterium]